MKGSVWVRIPSFPDYVVSGEGAVMQISQRRGTQIGRILKPFINHKGYLKVTLRTNGNTRQLFVHRLVAEAFVPNPDNKPQVNHKDGRKTHNAFFKP